MLCGRRDATGNKVWGEAGVYFRMQGLEGIAVTRKNNHPALPRALSDFSRSIWLRHKAAAEVVQYCKNCLLVVLFIVYSLQSLHAVADGIII